MKNKEQIFFEVQGDLESVGLRVKSTDRDRPWGGFLVIDEADSDAFLKHFFSDLDRETLVGHLSPKILIVAPHKKLSWQYHFRRSEIWRLVEGEAAVSRSETDVENETLTLKIGETITLKKGERHRLVGLSDWGIVAEIWIHADRNHPSDESDIVRLQDDFGR